MFCGILEYPITQRVMDGRKEEREEKVEEGRATDRYATVLYTMDDSTVSSG